MKPMFKFLIVLVALVASTVALIVAEFNKRETLLDYNVESLAWCEIKNASGAVVYDCTGNEGTCDGTKFGYSLICSGTLEKK